MKQSIAFLTVLMVALLLVSGFIVAGNVAQSDQIITQNAELADLRLKLRAQQSLYDDLLINTEEQTALLASTTKERDELEANLGDALLSIDETNSALTKQIADADIAKLKHEQEIVDLMDSLAQHELQCSTLASDLKAVTIERDGLSAALVTAEEDLQMEKDESIAASASYEQSLAADAQALTALEDECSAFIELFALWERVRAGDASEDDFNILNRDFGDAYPMSRFILPQLETETPSPAAQTTTPSPQTTFSPSTTFSPIVTFVP